MLHTLRRVAKDIIDGKSVISDTELQTERIKMCEACEHFTPGLRQCKICHCFLDLKTKIVASECPINKW